MTVVVSLLLCSLPQENMFYYNLFYYTSQLTSIIHTATTRMKHLVLMRRVSHGMFLISLSHSTLHSTNKCKNIINVFLEFFFKCIKRCKKNVRRSGSAPLNRTIPFIIPVNYYHIKMSHLYLKESRHV